MIKETPPGKNRTEVTEMLENAKKFINSTDGVIIKTTGSMIQIRPYNDEQF